MSTFDYSLAPHDFKKEEEGGKKNHDGKSFKAIAFYRLCAQSCVCPNLERCLVAHVTMVSSAGWLIINNLLLKWCHMCYFSPVYMGPHAHSSPIANNKVRASSVFLIQE
jgi:hypothetical protein